MDNILSVGGVLKMEKLQWETPEEITKNLALRVKNIRKRKGISQLQLSKMSNVSYGSIKRFETSGQISLLYLTQIAISLDCADEIRKIFSDVPYKNIKEIINGNK